MSRVKAVSVLALVSLALVGCSSETTAQPSQSAMVRPAVSAPPGVPTTGSNAFGWQVSHGNGPRVDVWFDFSCPDCIRFFLQNSETITALASADAQVFLHPTAMLHTPEQIQASTNATNALGCAIDEGKGLEFVASAFRTIAASGRLYTREDLQVAGNDAAANQAEFDRCLASGTYDGWAAANTAAMRASGINHVPTVSVNGLIVGLEGEATGSDLASALTAN